jgi:hypothetical protein
VIFQRADHPTLRERLPCVTLPQIDISEGHEGYDSVWEMLAVYLSPVGYDDTHLEQTRSCTSFPLIINIVLDSLGIFKRILINLTAMITFNVPVAARMKKCYV